MKKIFYLILLLLYTCAFSHGQPYFTDAKVKRWLQRSEESMPILKYETKTPVAIVRLIKDESAFQGYRMEKCGDINDLYQESFSKHDGVIIDFGEHLTGFLNFTLELLDDRDADAPTRLKFTCVEVPGELAPITFDSNVCGLSRAWIQDEQITLPTIPVESSISRRLSGRYVKIELLGLSSGFEFRFSKIEFKAQSAVSLIDMKLRKTTPWIIEEINKISLVTLKECMQTVYEDGPKRDRRLWIGDLYLESLANTVSYKNHMLTKRCLYLLAGCVNNEGLLRASVFEYPRPHPARNTYCLDYALLYNVALLEYYKATNDIETVKDLWPVVVRQVEIALRQYDEEWLYDMDKGPDYWLVFDWNDKLDRHVSMQALVIFSMTKSLELAKLIGLEKDVSDWFHIIKKMKKIARKKFYNQSKNVVISGNMNQISYLSLAWMTLADVLDKQESIKAFKHIQTLKDVCLPCSPYAYHYVLEAMVKTGLEDEARNLLIQYWGGMVNKGADTFWEVFDPNNDYLSPYGYYPINSYCHAWSCTPVYFINKYPDIFQVKN